MNELNSSARSANTRGPWSSLGTGLGPEKAAEPEAAPANIGFTSPPRLTVVWPRCGLASLACLHSIKTPMSSLPQCLCLAVPSTQMPFLLVFRIFWVSTQWLLPVETVPPHPSPQRARVYLAVTSSSQRTSLYEIVLVRSLFTGLLIKTLPTNGQRPCL